MFRSSATAAMIVAGLLSTSAVQAKVRPPLAQISMTKAKAIALNVAPGKLISSEYEKEAGGWRYSFDIQQTGHVQEIGINAMTGKIIENKSEGKVDRD